MLDADGRIHKRPVVCGTLYHREMQGLHIAGYTYAASSDANTSYADADAASSNANTSYADADAYAQTAASKSYSEAHANTDS